MLRGVFFLFQLQNDVMILLLFEHSIYGRMWKMLVIDMFKI